MPRCMLFAQALDCSIAGGEGCGTRATDFGALVSASLERLAQAQPSQLRAVPSKDYDTWLRFAEIRGWWRNEMVSRARSTAG